MNDWKEINIPILHEYADKAWQIKLGDDVYAELYEYEHEKEPIPIGYELEMQIHANRSIVGETINIKLFTYFTKDFNKAEKDARLIANKLIKTI